MMSPFRVFLFLLGLSVASCVNFTTVYEWGPNELDYVWPTEANKTGSFVPSKIEPRYIAVYKERLFISLLDGVGVPVTLVSLPKSSPSSNSPKLAPFPSWKLHEKGSCDSINQAKGLEVDPDGRLWVVDNGNANCSSKLWIFDLANNDKIELVHTFTRDVMFGGNIKRRLGGLVLDKTPDDTFAYIVDFENAHIVAFSLKRNRSWSVKTPGTTFYSLALSPKEESRQLYLGRGYSTELFSVPVSELRAETQNAVVRLLGEWSQLPLRMLVDNANVLYAAFWDAPYVSKWNISAPFSERSFFQVETLEAGVPFTFALDEAGTLWLTVRNETAEFASHKLLRTELGTKSYLYSSG